MTGVPISPPSAGSLEPTVSRLNWLVIPAWMGSLLFHGVLGVSIVFFSQLWGPRGDMEGDGGDSFREIGIRMLPPGPSGGTGGTSDGESAASSTEPVAAAAQPQPEMVLPTQELPVALSLPQSSPTASIPSVIGPGLANSLTTVDIGGLVKPAKAGSGAVGAGSPGTGGGTGGGDGAGGGGGTSFLGVKGVGKRFVYVIDRSFSMASDNALQAAKLELLASLQRLNESQQFQIIFYNNKFVVLNARGGRFDVFRGTDAQRLMVTEQIREITPDAGTRHLPAILEALNFKPDVIFLLTDGSAESALDMRDLEQIRQHNRQGTHIHCIEFGRGEQSYLGDAGNFLKVLAKQNDGQYVYRNLKAGF
ncbi:hypothetical protein SH661x_004435 [Planctomicrobium sp. SH661]|uniref:hypothetical protein n=1 Tax=Planctomicrobium sp. SH661 TaxID=3448124 RepID=UPI003F5B1FE5